MPRSALVIGLGVSGDAIARWLHGRGQRVVVVEDAPTARTRERASALEGIEVREEPSDADVETLVRAADVVVPSPGVPEAHPALRWALESGTAVLSEVELASREISVPIVGVTGTNGKTTVTTLIAAMLVASGVRAVAAGNIGPPLVAVVGQDVDVVVAELSSFQLRFTERFRPRVGVWLNFAEDHRDWHPDARAYAAAKTRIWANQAGDDVAVANADDPVVMDAAASAPARVTTFGLGAADWRVDAEVLRTPVGEELARVDTLPRRLPHDLANALAAAAAAVEAGASLRGARAALGDFRPLPHRGTLVGEAGGVRWYDDSKATNPHAALAAIRGFPSVVLVAGGRNKALDLSVLAEAADHVRHVVAIGEAAAEVEAAFARSRPVTVASSMRAAVKAAEAAARPGDVVLLAPACASFDWYGSYAERGDDFAAEVHALSGRRRGVED